MLNKVIRIFLLCLALNTSWALAQEPTMAEVYAAAQAGQMDKAQTLIQQVLISHPRSAKAHYVRAELFAREGNVRLAQESLQEAERLAPGLPFANHEAVSALKAQIGQLATRPGHVNSTTPVAVASTGNPSSPLPWLLLAGGVALLGFWFLRHRTTASTATAPASPAATQSASNSLSGPQTFGQSVGAGYPAPSPEPGMGSRIMGGVATGLAVGAGVMAAEAIGRRLMDRDEPVSHTHGNTGIPASDNTVMPFDTNTDMGGRNFGIADDSWDAGVDTGSGSDWDN
jgi:hypothetical protein